MRARGTSLRYLLLWVAAWPGLVVAPVRAAELLVLTRDGQVHRLRGEETAGRFASITEARALTAFEGRVVFARAGALWSLDPDRPGAPPRRVPGPARREIRALAGGTKLFAWDKKSFITEVDVKRGRQRTIAQVPNVVALAADGDAVFVAHDRVIEEPLAKRSFSLPGRPLALAACRDRLYVATREGPLWEIVRGDGARRDLGLGGWWGTLALTCDGSRLYAVTQAGKVWAVDPGPPAVKTIVAMSGWEAALSLVIRR
jgi:hypothetical protein